MTEDNPSDESPHYDDELQDELNELRQDRSVPDSDENVHPNADELQEELREILRGKSELDRSNMVWIQEPPSRPRGILSDIDREYLLGQKEYEHPQSEANRKQDIRERTANALQDFVILSSMLSREEREKVFNDESPDQQLQSSLEAVIAFVYLGLEEDLHELEQIIENGVYIGANQSKLGKWSGEIADVDVSISVEQRPDPAELIEKYEQGNTDQLTPAEIGILVRCGQIDPDDLDDLEETALPYPFARMGSE